MLHPFLFTGLRVGMILAFAPNISPDEDDVLDSEALLAFFRTAVEVGDLVLIGLDVGVEVGGILVGAGVFVGIGVGVEVGVGTK